MMGYMLDVNLYVFFFIRKRDPNKFCVGATPHCAYIYKKKSEEETTTMILFYGKYALGCNWLRLEFM